MGAVQIFKFICGSVRSGVIANFRRGGGLCDCVRIIGEALSNLRLCIGGCLLVIDHCFSFGVLCGLSMASGDSHSVLPDALSVAARIPCSDTRYCVEFLIEGQLRATADRDAIMTVLSSMHDDIKFIRDRDGDAARLFPVPPAMINAMSRNSSLNSGSAGASLSGSSNSGSRRKRLRDSSDGLTWVPCPFCDAEHWNEKSHIQHVSRSLLRCVIYCCFSLRRGLFVSLIGSLDCYISGCVPAAHHEVLSRYEGTLLAKAASSYDLPPHCAA